MTIQREMEYMKRSILYDLHTRIDGLQNSIALSLQKPLGTIVTDCTNKLEVSLPLQTIEDFTSFNEKLINPDKEKFLVKCLYILIILLILYRNLILSIIN